MNVSFAIGVLVLVSLGDGDVDFPAGISDFVGIEVMCSRAGIDFVFESWMDMGGGISSESSNSRDDFWEVFWEVF